MRTYSRLVECIHGDAPQKSQFQSIDFFIVLFFEFETKRMPKFLWTSLHQLEWIVAAVSSGLFSIKEQFPQIKFPFDNYWLKLVYAGEFKLVLILNERKKNSLNKKHRIETAQKYMQQLRLIDIWFMGN